MGQLIQKHPMNQNYFFTFDLNLAAVLLTLKYELLKLEKNNSKRIGFIFKREIGIENIIDDYFSNRLTLPALSLLNHQKNLKSRLYSNN